MEPGDRQLESARRGGPRRRPGRLRATPWPSDAASGAVYVGGRFTKAGDVGAWNFAVLEGETYRSLGDVSSYGGSTAEVRAIAVAGSGLYVGGSFTAAGNAAANHLARHDGTSWSPVGDGIDNEVAALAATPDGGVVVVGDFSMSGELRVPCGGVWTGTSWRTFGQGVNADPLGNGTVSAVVPDGAGAFVGGLFDQAGHVRVGSVARWDGTAWDAMAGGVRADQTFGQVFAMTRIGADLYVAGSFQTAGGAAANNVARWDGTSWSPLGDGVDDTVYALTVLGGKLYAGGTFNVAGGVRANHLACWDPATSTWSTVGNSPRYDDDIRALAAIDDRWLVVGGTFHRFFDGNTTVVQGLWGMVLFDTAAAPGERPPERLPRVGGHQPVRGAGLGERAAGAGRGPRRRRLVRRRRDSWSSATRRAPASRPTTSRSGTSRRAARGVRRRRHGRPGPGLRGGGRRPRGGRLVQPGGQHAGGPRRPVRPRRPELARARQRVGRRRPGRELGAGTGLCPRERPVGGRPVPRGGCGAERQRRPLECRRQLGSTLALTPVG